MRTGEMTDMASHASCSLYISIIIGVHVPQVADLKHEENSPTELSAEDIIDAVIVRSDLIHLQRLAFKEHTPRAQREFGYKITYAPIDRCE